MNQLNERTFEITDAFCITHGRRIVLEKNQFLYQHGDSGKAIYFLSSGEVRAYYSYENGDEKTMGIYTAPIMVGEDVFIGKDTPRWLNVVATKKSVCYSLDVNSYRKACMNNDALFNELMLSYLKKLQINGNVIYSTKYSSAEKRIIFFLYENKSMPLNFTQAYISEILGVARITVSRVLGKLRNMDVIETKYKKIYIKDPNKLRELLGEDPIAEERIN